MQLFNEVDGGAGDDADGAAGPRIEADGDAVDGTHGLSGPVWGYSALKTGLAYLPFVPATLATTVVAQQAMTRVGAGPLLIAGSVVSVGGMFCLSRITEHSTFITLAMFRVTRQDLSGADPMSEPTGDTTSPSMS